MGFCVIEVVNLIELVGVLVYVVLIRVSMDSLESRCLGDLFGGWFMIGECIFIVIIILFFCLETYWFCFFLCFLGVKLGVNGFVVWIEWVGFWLFLSCLGFVFWGDTFSEVGGLNNDCWSILFRFKFVILSILILLFFLFIVFKFFVKGFVFGKFMFGNVKEVVVFLLFDIVRFFLIVENVLLSFDGGIYFGKFLVLFFFIGKVLVIVIIVFKDFLFLFCLLNLDNWIEFSEGGILLNFCLFWRTKFLELFIKDVIE